MRTSLAILTVLLLLSSPVIAHRGATLEVTTTVPQSIVDLGPFQETAVIFGQAPREEFPWDAGSPQRITIPTGCTLVRVGYSVIHGNNGGTTVGWQVRKNSLVSPLDTVGLPGHDWPRTLNSGTNTSRSFQSRYIDVVAGDYFELYWFTDSQIPISLDAGWAVLWVECHDLVFASGFESGDLSSWDEAQEI